MNKKDIRSLNLSELEKEFESLNQPKYRAIQVYRWLHKDAINKFDEMSNLPKTLRNDLKNNYKILYMVIEKKFISKYNDTVKYLLQTTTGDFVEAVVMKYRYGYSMCISTQVGCKMGCSFCATGKDGFVRNLYPSEMLSEIQTAEHDLNVRISHVVLMGMGEPLDNYDNVLKFLKLVSSPDGMNLSARHISVSTCGLVDKIYKLADEKLGITLSISLHAPNDSIRNTMMKINKRFNMNELLKACDYYIQKTGRRISFEYAMISGVNDSDECAKELSKKLSGKICHVNLIPVNPIEETNYKRSSDKRLNRFCEILSRRGINVTIRRTLGSDINASCGQLKRKKLNKEDDTSESIQRK